MKLHLIGNMGIEILSFLEVGIVLIIGALIGIYLERNFRKFYALQKK